MQINLKIQNEWRNRVYIYVDSQYRYDCLLFLKHFCKVEKLRLPLIVLLESPVGCLFAAELIKVLKVNNHSKLTKSSCTDIFLLALWNDAITTNELINGAAICETERDSIIKTTLKSMEGINLKKDDKYPEHSYGNVFQYLFHSRNMENIKKKISVHLWESYYPIGIPINVDFMISSLNKFPDYNGSLQSYNYDELIFFDLMCRLHVFKDQLFNDLRRLLLNGVFDFYWTDQICLISKLPKSVKRNTTGKLTSRGVAIEFYDGYNYRIN